MDTIALDAARQKYLKLGREIEGMPASIDRENALHSHSKLGIFLEQAVGSDAWRGARG